MNMHAHTNIHTYSHKKMLNVSLSIRANGTEHLYFLITALILPHLNVSLSIVATHHFHSNPPREMNWNFSLSVPLAPQ